MALTDAQKRAKKKYRETHVEKTRDLNRKHQKTWYDNHKEEHRNKMKEYMRKKRSQISENEAL